MSNNADDKQIRVTKKTHEIFEELKYKTKDPVRTLAEEAVMDLRIKRLKKGKKS